MDAADDILDAIYEAAVLPQLWPEVLGRVNKAAEVDAGALFVAPHGSVRWTATPNFVETVTAFIDEGYMPNNPRNKRALTRQHAGFIVDQDIFTEEELRSEPLFAEFLRPRGWGWASGSVILMPTQEVLTFHFENTYSRGPIERRSVALLDELRPHLARSALLSCRLELERLNASLTGLEALGCPAAVIGNGGRVLATNSYFDTLGAVVTPKALGRFALWDRKADRAIHDLLEQMARGLGTARSVVAAGSEDRPAAIFHLVPLRGRARSMFVSADALVVATLAEAPKAPHFEVLNALFDLTPTEARIARLLTSGMSAQEIAALSDVTVGTVRGHIKSVLRKAGMHRQAELIGFLAGLGLFTQSG